MKICGWTIERGNKGLNTEWIARDPEDSAVACWLTDSRELVLEDSTRYYPFGSYTIPLAVIEALQARRPP